MPVAPRAERRPVGRPRSEEARRTVLNAAHALFDRGGLPAATIEAIAARAGVAKTTIYRRWPSRAALLVDVLLEVATAEAPPPGRRDPLRAIRTEMRQAAVAVNGFAGRLMAALIGEAQQDQMTRDALITTLIKPRTAATAATVREAQAAGLIRPNIPPQLVVDLLIGPLFYRLLVGHERVSEQFIAQVFDEAVAGLRPAKRRKARRER